MAINEKKTKAKVYNSRIKWDLVPELSLNGKDNIDIVDAMKIVGFIMRSRLRQSRVNTLVKLEPPGF